MKFHKYAELFPLLEGDEFDALVEDVRENGLLEPVFLYEKQIIDGRNRFRACEVAGVEPEFREYSGDDPLGFVVSMNLKRRHLSPSQLYMLATTLEEIYAKEAKERQRASEGRGKKGTTISSDLLGEARTKAAQAVGGVWEAGVTKAKRVKELAPELAEEVWAGRMPIGQAYEIARSSEQESVRRDIAKKVQEEHATVAGTRSLIAHKLGKVESPPTAREQRELSGISAWQWGVRELRATIPTMELGAAERARNDILGTDDYEGTLSMLERRIQELKGGDNR